MKNNISETVAQYKVDTDEYSIDDQLLFETILLMIRGETINYSPFKKKERTKKEKHLSDNLNNKEIQLDKSDNKTIEKEIITEKKTIQQELEELYEIKTQGSILRSKATWTNQSEKPTSFFLSLESRNFLNKSFSRKQDSNGHTLEYQTDIQNEVKLFHEKLYSKHDVSDINLHNLLQGYSIPRLSNDVASKLEGILTEDEILLLV